MKKNSDRECKCKRKIRWQFFIERAVWLVIRFLPDIIEFLMNLFSS